jgi:hypothetical protein
MAKSHVVAYIRNPPTICTSRRAGLHEFAEARHFDYRTATS